MQNQNITNLHNPSQSQMRDVPVFATTSGSGEYFTDAKQAVQRLAQIYDTNVKFIAHHYQAFCNGFEIPEKVHACYPEIRVTVDKYKKINPAISHGFVDTTGVYATTITRPDLYALYLEDQLSRIIANHAVAVEVRTSNLPIPVKYLNNYDALSIKGFSEDRLHDLHEHFTGVDIAIIDDTIADGEFDYFKKDIKPLSLFDAPRTDLSLQRLRHYTGTSPEYFQPFIIFTNYQIYIQCFCELAKSLTGVSQKNSEKTYKYISFVSPSDEVQDLSMLVDQSAFNHNALQATSYQMPAYHLVRDDGLGISIVNIGVGPSNAKTITDCLAVLRPHCWLMVGHCAGLDARMQIGDMILANAYERKDGVLDRYVPLQKPIPSIAEVQMALSEAMKDVTGEDELKRKLRTGTVMTTADRNWEWQPQDQIYCDLQKSTAIAVEMESATIATNGYRFRVPYGTLLSVSDMPLHNQPKLPRSARTFYQRSRTDHLMTAIRACELMAKCPEELHSRKLRRPIGEVAFR